MTNSVNELNKILDSFYQSWGDSVIAWFEFQMTTYKAEHRIIWDKLADHLGYLRNTKEANEEYREFRQKWADRLGVWWYDVESGRVENVSKRVRKDMERKKVELFKKVEDKVGYVTSVDLHFGQDGSPNGIIAGDRGTIRLETISAGGWNIQCFHYRVLVKPVK